MPRMRIVTLLPAATEIVCALGLRDQLYGRSHACDYPADVAGVPVMTFSWLDAAGDSATREQEATARLRDGLAVFGVYEDALAAAQPDLIITQGLCAVCAITEDETRRVIREHAALASSCTNVLSLDATTIDGILDSIARIGAAAGVPERADALTASLRARLDAVRAGLCGVAHRPSVAALEWLDPPFAPGHWVPEQIALAGGRPALGDAGAHSARITWDDVSWAQPEMVVLIPCGYSADAAAAAFDAIAALDVWRDLPATYLNQIYAADANGLFSRPGPRVVEGVEVLAQLLHPNRFGKPDPSQALRVSHRVSTHLRDG